MRLNIDLDQLALVESATNSRTIAGIAAKRGDNFPVELVFLRGGVETRLPTGSAIVFAAKENLKFDADAVVYEDSFAAPTTATATATIGSDAVASIAVTSGGGGYTVAPKVTISGGGGSGAAAEAEITNGVVTGITVTNGGSGYTSAPSVTITPIGTTATATATLGGDSIASIAVGAGGSGYSVAPTVIISGGGGSGATATAVISGGVVIGITVTNPGSGYASAPTVTILSASQTAIGFATVETGAVAAVVLGTGGTGYLAAPTVAFSGGGGIGAAGYAEITDGVVTGVVMTDGGSGYTSAPTVTFSAPGSGATATASLRTDQLKTIAITSGGGGYQTAPRVAITGGGGAGAAATAEITNGVVTGITITSMGSGYTTAPTITLSGHGSGAAGTASLASGQVRSASVTSGGTGYTSAPAVTISGGGGTGAEAEATITNGVVTGITITSGGTGYTTAPTVTISDSTAYSGAPSLNTEPLNALFAIDANASNDVPSVDLMAEITWSAVTDEPVSCQTFRLRVANDVIRGTEGLPVVLPTAAEWLLGGYPPAVGWLLVSGAGIAAINGYYLPAYHDESGNTIFARVDSTATPIESSWPYPVDANVTIKKSVSGWKIFQTSQSVYECTTDELTPSDGVYESVVGHGTDPAPTVTDYTTQAPPYFRCMKNFGGDSVASPLYVFAENDSGIRTWLAVDLKGINGFSKTNVYNSSFLPDPSGLEGVRLLASHISEPAFGNVVIPAGGINTGTYPVYCDGTAWRVG